VVTGAVEIDIREAGYDAYDRQRLDVLDLCPDAAHVRVKVGDRLYVSPDAARWLHKHASRLHIEVVGDDPGTVQRFVEAARTGVCEVTL
jgi:hypothetical protein